MAKWQIDRFKVKPSGFLASWRERAIFVDEDGVIYSECVPGKECMNLPCISDYNKEDRKYNDGSLITTYCNIVDHSLWKIYAQNCTPFANAVEEINVPRCGYEEPLPAPSVPENPFGTSPYGLYVTYSFCDKKNVTGEVRIYRKLYEGDPITIESGGYAPVLLKYKDTDNKFESIISLECTLTFISDENFQLSYLYSGDQREFLVEVYKASSLLFKGFIIPDSCSEPFAQPSYAVSIRATDGIGALKKITYPMPSSNSVDVRQRWVDILAYSLSLTNLNLDIRTSVNVYDQGMSNGIDDDPLAQSSVSPLRFTDGNSIDTAYDVLKALCNQFTATLKQVNGEWVFIRNSELNQDFIRTRLYLYTGFFLRGEEIRNVKTAGVRNTDFITEAGSSISIGNAYKRSVVKLDYGSTAALVQNGNFNSWDGQNFSRWTKYGGLSISRFQKSIPGSGGAMIPIEDYAALFNQSFQPGKYLESSPIDGVWGNQINLTFTTSNTQGVSILRFRIKIGQYYLTEEYLNEKGTNLPGPNFQALPPMENGKVNQNNITYKWVTSDGLVYANPYTLKWANEKTYARVYIDNPNRKTNTIVIKLPNLPRTDPLSIQIFGFENQKASYPSAGIWIDDIKTEVTSDNKDNISEGLLYVSEQLGFYTEEPEETEVIFGEYNEDSKPRPDRVPQALGGGINTDLYAIYTKDNSYATGWKTYGDIGDYVPIGMVAARTIIKNYQKPYIFYNGTLSGSYFSHLNVIRIIVECDNEFSQKTFLQLGVNYDIVNLTIDGTFVEIFSRPVVTNDYILDNYPGTELPPFIQNPTQPQPLEGDGIFTPEFTPEFV